MRFLRVITCISASGSPSSSAHLSEIPEVENPILAVEIFPQFPSVIKVVLASCFLHVESTVNCPEAVRNGPSFYFILFYFYFLFGGATAPHLSGTEFHSGAHSYTTPLSMPVDRLEDKVVLRHSKVYNLSRKCLFYSERLQIGCYSRGSVLRRYCDILESSGRRKTICIRQCVSGRFKASARRYTCCFPLLWSPNPSRPYETSPARLRQERRVVLRKYRT